MVAESSALVGSDKVLIIDCEYHDRLIMTNMLSNEFRVTCTDADADCVRLIDNIRPNIIILNLSVQGERTEEICVAAQQVEPRPYLMFLSDINELSNSIKAYELGADDFIAIPYNPLDVYFKVRVQIENARIREQLKLSAEKANDAAFSALACNSDMAIVIRFMEQITGCLFYDDLGIAFLKATEDFGVNAVVQIRGLEGELNFRCASDSLEAKLLRESGTKSKMIESNNKLVINQKKISALIKDMPSPHNARYNRIKDNMNLLINAAESRIDTLNIQIESECIRDQSLEYAIGKTRQNMRHIQEHFIEHENDIKEKVNTFKDHMDNILMTLSLDEEQEEKIMMSLEEFINGFFESYKAKNLINKSFDELLADLDKLRKD